ncbi:hypothetical protein ACFPA8_11700 [Streptomyces ovatisporus]|uniref:Uncharacterized protein n=1 Tax=Streptomyces ovatisporus TaxID=1128682 RepID=A0ABV9A4G3_9ACTN
MFDTTAHTRPFSKGDILQVHCPWTPTTVAEVEEDYAVLHWPWAPIDPAPRCPWYANGPQRALPRAVNSPESMGELYRTDPEPMHLSAGGECRVGIPTVKVSVAAVIHCEPRDAHGLPQPDRTLVVVPLEHSWLQDYEDGGSMIHIPSAEPITIERLPAS